MLGTAALVAGPSEAGTVTLIAPPGTTNCSYSVIALDERGNMTATCDPAALPPTPAPTPAPATCASLQPSNARVISDYDRPAGGGKLPTGQTLYNNPSTVVADGTMSVTQILVVPFTNTGTTGATRASILPGNCLRQFAQPVLRILVLGELRVP